ncbi:type II toxin-antitoxin system prevent-host-death family antitoxin [Sphaerotilus sp.]|uniref:type II toxin-antitoxin system Phd/YefM family antitoxin n=1 Tax=Sphaerotilus sp. TaxID=2093942 RepID=UPI00286E7C7F|nr:type II toxin-antitoxin system prevent-host-death family antitoxin [Sphaerotilus sp.]
MTAASVNVTELRQHLPDYLRQVQLGEEFTITWHGRTIARLIPDQTTDVREAARQRLQALRGTMIVGDVVNTADDASTRDAWTGRAWPPVSSPAVTSLSGKLPCCRRVAAFTGHRI